MALAASYAPDSFGRLKEVGAALDDVLARQMDLHKKNTEATKQTVEKKWVRGATALLYNHICALPKPRRIKSASDAT